MLRKSKNELPIRITPKKFRTGFCTPCHHESALVQLVTLQGVAGTGKTLLALAGALEQIKQYKQVHMARPIVPLSNKEIGFLPGDIKSKITPFMEPLYDNLKFIQSQFKDNESRKQVNYRMA